MAQPMYKRRGWKFPEYCGGNKEDWRQLSDACKLRDGWKCVKCGAAGSRAGGNAVLQAHHIVPKSRGGADALYNLETVCVNCHGAEHKHLRR